MADWLPFESAPKDPDTDIIVLSLWTSKRGEHKEWELGVAHWLAPTPPKLPHWPDGTPGEWVVEDSRIDAFSGHYSDPIWWMPFNLPELPS